MIKLIRQPLWEDRLAQYLTELVTQKFDRGVFDCVRFTGKAVEKITGHNIADDFTELYRTDEEAMALVQSWGADGFYKKVNEVCTASGFEQTIWRQAMRGDICLFHSINDAWAGGLGICCGSDALTPSAKGMRSVSMRSCRAVWHIPYL